jgi:glutamate-1-semialdehyde 2,1-aminomutase
MERIAPAGDVYQAGTLSGNPLAVAAGQAMLDALSDRSLYDRLEDTGAALEAGLENILADLSIPGTINRQGSMMCLYFSDQPVRSLGDAMASDASRFKTYHARMLEGGVILPPSPYEAIFLSTAHAPADIDHILEAARNALTS